MDSNCILLFKYFCDEFQGGQIPTSEPFNSEMLSIVAVCWMKFWRKVLNMKELLCE